MDQRRNTGQSAEDICAARLESKGWRILARNWRIRAGEIDLIALVRVREHDQIAAVVPGGINKVPGVLATETHIAFQAYSQHDLEAAFSIGLEG